MIEFRAWDKRYEIMIYQLPDGYRLSLSGNIEIVGSDFKTVRNSDEFIPEQYSGVKSNNNKGDKIFAGDKVYIAGYGEYIAKFPFTELYDALMEDDVGEVMGNIHE